MTRITLSGCALAALMTAGMTVGLATAASAAECSVGISMYTLGAPYFAAQEAAAKDQAAKAGCKVTSADAQNDMNKQIGDIEDMIAKGINLLILNPRDPEGLVPAVNSAAAQGVKVIIIDSSLNPKANFVSLVQSSNDQNGFLVGQWLAKATQGKQLKIALISGDKGNVVGQDRRLGVFKGLVEGQLVNDGKAGFEVVGQGWGGWSEGGGLKAAEDLLTAHPDINVLLGENDSMALGGIKALEAAGKQPAAALGGKSDVLVLAAADGQKEALKMIQDGKYGATGLNDPDLVARTGVDVGLKALKGALPADWPKIYYTTPTAITKDNVDKFYRPNAVF